METTFTKNQHRWRGLICLAIILMFIIVAFLPVLSYHAEPTERYYEDVEKALNLTKESMLTGKSGDEALKIEKKFEEYYKILAEVRAPRELTDEEKEKAEEYAALKTELQRCVRELKYLEKEEKEQHTSEEMESIKASIDREKATYDAKIAEIKTVEYVPVSQGIDYSLSLASFLNHFFFSPREDCLMICCP